jgi:hypothetical protein
MNPNSVNWSELMEAAEEGGAYDALPEGAYTAKILDATVKTTGNGKPMIAATFEVAAGPYSGRRFWNNFVITKDNPNAMAWFFRHMKALGLGKDFFAMGPSLEATAQQLVGKTCVATLGVRTYQGETRNEVKKIESANTSTSAHAPTVTGTVTSSTVTTPSAPSVPF